MLSRAPTGDTLEAMRRIRYRNLDLPDVLCVADGKSIRPWDENTASELALTGMLLSQGAKRAQEMLDAAAAAGADPIPTGRK